MFPKQLYKRRNMWRSASTSKEMTATATLLCRGVPCWGGGGGATPSHFFDKPSVKIRMVGKIVIICNNYKLVVKIAVIIISFDKDALVSSKTEIIFISFNKNTFVGKMEIIITSFEKITWSVNIRHSFFGR